ncbi:hypothetical protein DPMN_082763 [Dreissena polymorpha]|uniref:Uncharacterized protein n=1 Tax=Dreissena polymorpha TaxID=45954 RepID=A0A9D3YAM3_DREPO|nr:hypothetical protein DPMN_082763 [Dreissena polymorpha]
MWVLKKNSPPHGGHVFQPTGTIFQLVQEIIKANLLTKFHDERTINVASRVLGRKNAPPRGGHVFQPTGTICELVKHIIKMNHLTKFHDDRTKMWSLQKMPRPLAAMIFHSTRIILELVQDIIRMNLWTKFHEDRTINVASKMLTRQMLTPHNARQTKCDHKSSP